MENNIKRQLYLDVINRKSAHEYLDWVIKNFDDLYTSSPLLSNDILNQYETFNDLLEGEINMKEINRSNNVIITIEKEHDYKNCDDKSKYQKQTVIAKKITHIDNYLLNVLI